MRIDNAMRFFYQPPVAQIQQPVINAPADTDRFISPAATVELSPQALAAQMECETCDNRRYVDQSDDPSVSFQTPTHISPGQSAAVVLAHEREHVVNEQARADRKGNRVVSQTVTLQMANCPECNRMYVSGGTTRTITVNDSGNDQASYRPASTINLTV